MKACFITMITVLLITMHCNGQGSKPKKSAISIEIGKTGLIYNLNYDRRFLSEKSGLRFGVGSNLARFLTAYNISGGCYVLIGENTGFLELGADIQYLVVNETSDDQRGLVFTYPDYSIKTVYPSLNFGYRKYGKSSLFRVGASPGIIGKKFIPGGYISWGFTF